MISSLLLFGITATCCASPTSCEWFSDYREGLARAADSNRLAVVWFTDHGSVSDWDEPLCELFAELNGDQFVSRHVFVRLPLSASTSNDGQATRLIDHPAFADLKGGPGVAIIDMTDADSKQFHRVVSILPFGENSSALEMRELLKLPLGSLTQRTLMLAVRTHPEQPQSASQACSTYLCDECSSHAAYQAQIGVQGHHDWEHRFHRINAKLGDELVAYEVCAESWPGEGLWDAARECVRSWRHSAGHWELVRGAHPQFGYDMRRGANGVWYGVGIFGRPRR